MEKNTNVLTSDNDKDVMKTIELSSVDLPDVTSDKKYDEGSPTKTSKFADNTRSCLASVWEHIKNMKIEVVMFFYMFAYMVRSVTSTNMIIDKVCLVHFEYPADVCANLSAYTTYKTEVEKLANNYHLGHSLISIIPSAILGCVIAPWSDRYGRKLPMIVAFVAIIIDGLGTTICAHFMYSRVEYYYITAVFAGLSGGFLTIMTVVYSYASDITKAEGRTVKYALLEMSFGLAFPLGSVVGGWVFKFSGYVPVFLISTTGHVIGLVWTLFVLKETRGIGNTDSWKTKWKNLWSFDAFMENFRATMKQRPHQGRKQILMLLAGMSVLILTQASAGSMMYLFVFHVYKWDNAKYSTVSAVYAVFGIVAMMIAVPLLKKIKAGDPMIGIIGSISTLLKTIGIGIATKEGVYYLANLFGLLSSLASLAGRSRISKVVSKNDLGKVFSFVTTAEMVGPIISTIVFSQVYNASLEVYPGMMFLICGALVGATLGVYIWLACLPAVNYEEFQEKNDEDEDHTADNEKNYEKEKSLVV